MKERDRDTRRDRAIEACFDAYYPGLVRLATLLLSDPGSAEEIVQDVFVDTYAGWWRIRHPERVGAYLRTAVVNRCRSRFRRRGAEQRGNRTVWATDGDFGHAPETEASPDALDLLRAIGQLPTRQREAVVLRYYEDLSEADVATSLGCSIGTVKSQLSKARSNLAALMTPPVTSEEASA